MDIRSKFQAALWGGRKDKTGVAVDGDAGGERTIALEQIWSQVSTAINERDPEEDLSNIGCKWNALDCRLT